ncbi:Protein SMG7, partial [Termitomyces sp. J132]
TMTEQPATIAREAKGIHQSLKDLLKTKEPFDKEVDFQRKNLRRRYLNLLLVHPYAKESKDVENHLWMQTSYAFIASYKQRILNLGRVIQSKMRQTPNQRPPNAPVVEHRKLVQRFRQFLADEEKFWSQLVVRLRRSFALDAATPALLALGIISKADDLSTNTSAVPEGGAPSNGRNHFQFPPEDASTIFTASSPEVKASWLAILSKALVCLGDIARYRELYNESGGRPRAGQEEGGLGRNRRNRRSGQPEEPIPRPRNYEKAQQCYEHARLLVPDDGNPSHQLAIIATYRKDSFVSLTHYYRALCVRAPYDTASENLGSVLGKSLEAWKTRSRHERDRQEALPPRVQVEAFRENIVVLHSLWKVGMEKGIKKMESHSRRHSKVVLDAFMTLLSQRYLPTDMISNAIILSQGALWKHRMIRTPTTTTQSKRPEQPPPPEGTSVIIEWHILEHLFDLHRALLEVGLEELQVPPPRDVPGDDLAQRITATFRRCLPALRIASKWLRANFKYVNQDHEFNAFQELKRIDEIDMTRNPKFKVARTSVRTQRLWQAYARFSTELARKFELSKLPQLTAPLDEDIEMRGFLPLKDLMRKSADTESDLSAEGARPAQEAHPNDWQLMRIADLIRDAREIAKLENSPVALYGFVFSVRDDIIEPQLPPTTRAEESNVPIGQQNLLTSIRDTRRVDKEPEEDNMTEATSRTDDEVLREAFNFLNAPGQDNEVDDEEDEIVWNPRAPTSPIIISSLPSPTSHATPLTNTKPLLSPGSKNSPTHAKTLSPFMTPSIVPTPLVPTTAQDLLNDVISGRSTLNHLGGTATQPALLFGSDLSHGPSHSIWSASHDEKSLKFTSQPNQTYHQAKVSHGSSSFDASQSSVWSSTYPSATQTTQNSQPHLIGALPPGPYPQQSIVNSTHQRVPSASVGVSQSSQYLSSQQFSALHDSFAYPQLATQQSIQRPDALGLGLGNPNYLNSQLHSANPNMYYQTGPPPSVSRHTQHPSVHDPRQLAQQYFGQSSASASSQLWGNVG